MCNFCSKCYAKKPIFQETGIADDGRICDIYFCPDCKNYTRVFGVPQTEREVVEDALRTEALSDAQLRALLPPVEVPAREKDVEEQLRLFTDTPRVFY